jgi:hypothetical protein
VSEPQNAQQRTVRRIVDLVERMANEIAAQQRRIEALEDQVQALREQQERRAA